MEEKKKFFSLLENGSVIYHRPTGNLLVPVRRPSGVPEELVVDDLAFSVVQQWYCHVANTRSLANDLGIQERDLSGSIRNWLIRQNRLAFKGFTGDLFLYTDPQEGGDRAVIGAVALDGMAELCRGLNADLLSKHRYSLNSNYLYPYVTTHTYNSGDGVIAADREVLSKQCSILAEPIAQLLRPHLIAE